jgi:predicted dehydrogenase
MADTIGVGVIGAGGISHSHLLAYRSRTNRELARVVAIADVDAGRAKQQAAQYEIPHVFTDYRELLSDPDVQAVSICTPPFLHVEQSVAALRAGQHVLCEKPVSPTLAGLDAIAGAQGASGAVFEGVFQHRVGQGAQQVKALIERGSFGRVLFGLAETLWQRDQAYYDVWWRGTWEQECGGATMGQAIHSIDMLLWLMGEPESVFAEAATVKLAIDVEDTSLATVRFRGGALAQIIVTVNAQDNRSRLEIFGEDLQAVSSESAYDPTQQPFRFASVDPAKADAAVAEATELLPEGPKHLHVAMVHDFITSVRDGTPPLVGVDECRSSMQLITGMYKSAMTAARVALPVAPDDPWYAQIPPPGSSLSPAPTPHTHPARYPAPP